MALPVAAGTWKRVKWLIKAAEAVVPAAGSYLYDQLTDDASVADVGWMRVNVLYARSTPAGTAEDLAQFKLDIVNITSGAIDTSWIASDFTAVATALDTFTTSLSGIMTANHTLSGYRAYKMSYNPADPGPTEDKNNPQKPFADAGPPVWQVSRSVPGTGGTVHPYQTAITATLKTAWPGHWGRIYIPGFGGTFDSNGRIASTQRTFYANAMYDLDDDLAAAGFLLAVPVSQLKKQRFHALLGVQSHVVDDIPDVVRRRRPKMAAARTVGVE